MRSEPTSVLLSFDVEGPPQREDFITNETLRTIQIIVNLLNEYDFKGLFFLTETTAKKISQSPTLLKLLSNHEIGYHSTSHSTRPGIFEYTDIESYEHAILVSTERETSSVNPLTGSISGKGGIEFVRRVFPKNKINAFRAPFLCWSPPHLEALRKLGFRYDFSADIYHFPVIHRGLIFFPYPVVVDSVIGKSYFILRKLFRREFTVILLHPSLLNFKEARNVYKHYKNPYLPFKIEKHSKLRSKHRLNQLNAFLSGLNKLRKINLIKVQTISSASTNLSSYKNCLKAKNVAHICEKSLARARERLDYHPKFLRHHFQRFFQT